MAKLSYEIEDHEGKHHLIKIEQKGLVFKVGKKGDLSYGSKGKFTAFEIKGIGKKDMDLSDAIKTITSSNMKKGKWIHYGGNKNKLQIKSIKKL